MIEIEQEVNRLERCIQNHEPVFSTPVRDVQDLLRRVLEKEPRLVVYIQNIGWESRPLESVIRIQYGDVDIPLESIERIRSDDEFESCMNRAIRMFSKQKIVLTPVALDLSRCHALFMTKYEGYYSNLTGIEFGWQHFSLAPSWNVATFQFQYRIGRFTLGMMNKAVQQKIEAISPHLFLPEMTPETKAYIAHNYLARTVTYWKKEGATPLESSYMQSAYGALINGQCVCQGYAEAYKRLLDSQDVICEVVCGKIRGSPEHHAWNIVSFDEGHTYFHVDVTWDSVGHGEKRNDYFCLTDAKLTADRIWTRPSRMVCVSSKNMLQEVKLQIFRNKALFLRRGIDKKYLE